MVKVLEIFLWHLCCSLAEGTLESKNIKLSKYVTLIHHAAFKKVTGNEI
jgi:hypothetical protein